MRWSQTEIIIAFAAFMLLVAVATTALAVHGVRARRAEDADRLAAWSALAAQWGGRVVRDRWPFQLEAVVDGVPVHAANQGIKGHRTLARARLARADLPRFSVREGTGLGSDWVRVHLHGIPDRSVILKSPDPDGVVRALSRDATALATWAAQRTLYLECNNGQLEMWGGNDDDDIAQFQLLIRTCASVARG